MPRRRVHIVLIAWAVVLPLLCAGALVKRDFDHRLLCAQIIQSLLSIGETGTGTVSDYLWSSQGKAIYLMNLGYGRRSGLDWSPLTERAATRADRRRSGTDPLNEYLQAQFESLFTEQRGHMGPLLNRELLLCEARRCYDWKYLYPVVNNYDLRQQLITTSLRDFPESPRVHWAAGQLSLAAGDYELAVQELGKTIGQAQGSKPTALRDFCGQTGISEEHLRGRYACALTMLGKWDEADVQTELAKAANDGAEAPLDLTFYGDTDLEALWHEQVELLQQRRRASEAFVASNDPATIRAWIDSLKVPEHAYLGDSDPEDNIGPFRDFEAYQTKLQAYTLAADWPAVEKLLEQEAPEWYGFNYYNNANPDQVDIRRDAALLLMRLATGKPLGDQGGKTSEDGTILGGELRGLLDADYLPFLVRSEIFAKALAQSGRRLDDVLTEVRAVTQPERYCYYDWSNGKLR